MKQEYLNNLHQEFDNKGIGSDTYSQIVDKYSAWYDRLLSDGKTDEEIYGILKSPEVVATIFAEKFRETVSHEPVLENTAPVQNFTEEKVNLENNNQEVGSYTIPEFTPNYIIKTNSRGKQKYFVKRSFLGGLGVFLVFMLASSVALPILFGLFSVTLTASFTTMLLFFTPFYYLCFIWRYDSVSYLEHITTGKQIADNVLTLPVDKINDIIEYLNQITSFQFPVFLQAILISIFAFAALLLSLYLCLSMFRVNVAYFSYFFNKMSLKRVKNKDLRTN